MTAAISKRQPGWWYPYIFVGAFCIILPVNGFMAYNAVHSFTGVEDRAYEKGIAYNQVIAQKNRQAALGWIVEAQVEPRSGAQPNSVLLTVSYKDRDGKPVQGLDVVADWVRPTQAGHDQQTILTESSPGQYTVPATLALPGQWDVHLAARRGELTYVFDQRVLVR